MSSKKKEKVKKSRKHLFGKHKKKHSKGLSPRESDAKNSYTTPFDDLDDSLASSSEFEDVPSPRLTLSTSSRSQSSEETMISRRSSVGGHRPVKETRISTHQVAKPEISNDQFQKTDDPVFTRGHVRTRSATLSTPNAPNFWHSESEEEEDHAQSPRRLTERSKTKLFTPKMVFLEQENRLEELNNRTKTLHESLKDMETRMNELSSVNRAMYHRVVTLMSMLSEISRGAEYYMKDSKSLPYSILKPHDQRAHKKGWFSCCAESPRGYEMVPEDEPSEGENSEDHPGWLCFTG